MNIAAEQQIANQIDNPAQQNPIRVPSTVGAEPAPVGSPPTGDQNPASDTRDNPDGNPPPVASMPQYLNPLDELAVTPEEKARLDFVHQKLMEIRLELCEFCHEKWFDLNI